MNNSLYEDYMRSVLGYQQMNNYQDTYRYNNYDNYFGYDVTMAQPMQPTRTMTAMSNIQIQELESCYPDIYKIVYPMVQKACSENRGEVTAELIERLTDEIYSAVEDRELLQDRGISDSEAKNMKTSAMSNKTENKKEDRYCKDCDERQRNTGVNDIIRILLLRELIGKPGFPGFRPPRPPPLPPPRPPRPPMRPPMGPGPGGRPPRPRGGEMSGYESSQYFATLDDGYDLYEK